MRSPEPPASNFFCRKLHAGSAIEVGRTSYGTFAAYASSQPTLRQSKRRLDGTEGDVNGNRVRRFYAPQSAQRPAEVPAHEMS